MRRALVITLCLAGVAAVAAASDKGLWFDFKPYPDARLLCTEVVLGAKGEHITWRTLATTDKGADVVTFFETSEGTRATERMDGSYNLAATADPERVKLSIYPARLLEAFPHCSEGTRKGERTVMLVSQRL